MTDALPPAPGEFLVYAGDNGKPRVQVRISDGTVWLTQRQMADLYQVSVPTVSEHLTNVYQEGELPSEATIRKFLTVRTEGNRSVSRLVDHYSLPAILAIGYRVRSAQGTRFRQWATTRLDEYLVKGFVMDDERLKSAGNFGEDYFEELLERIRGIRDVAAIRPLSAIIPVRGLGAPRARCPAGSVPRGLGAPRARCPAGSVPRLADARQLRPPPPLKPAFSVAQAVIECKGWKSGLAV